MEPIIKKAIEGGWKELPKGDTIDLCQGYMESRGIRVKNMPSQELVIFALANQKFTSIKVLKSLFAQGITGILRNMVTFFQMKRLVKNLKLHNQNGLAEKLGITKGGVSRLIWLLDDVRNTKNGSGQFSSEMISLVRDALLKERILKQTTSLLDMQPSLTKNESQPTNKQWRVSGYGMKVMDAPYVGGVIEVKA